MQGAAKKRAIIETTIINWNTVFRYFCFIQN